MLACLTATLPAGAQVGPIEPIVIVAGPPSATLADLPDLGDEFVVGIEVKVAPDGTVAEVVVTSSSGNAQADQAAIGFMKEKRFLPALDARARPVAGSVRGSVEVNARGRMREMKASLKPPDIPNEIERVRKLTCRDFLWEIERLRRDAASTDLSREIMPWVSLRVYMMDRKLPKGAEPAYLEKWPQALSETEALCKSTPDKSYLADTLTLVLDSLAPNP